MNYYEIDPLDFLVVDDTPNMLSILTMILKGGGARKIHAASGVDKACEILEDNNIDLVMSEEPRLVRPFSPAGGKAFAATGGLDRLRRAADVKTGATNIEQALIAARRIMGSERSARLVLISDGAAREGSLDGVFDSSTGKPFSLTWLRPVPLPAAPDAAVTGLRLPPLVRQGDRVAADIDVHSNVERQAALSLVAAGGAVPGFRRKVRNFPKGHETS